MSRFVCPACGFAVFNRRVARCESCAAPLPAELLLTEQQIAALDAEHARNDKIRLDLARQKQAQRRSGGDGGGDTGFDDGNGGGDGGGD